MHCPFPLLSSAKHVYPVGQNVVREQVRSVRQIGVTDGRGGKMIIRVTTGGDVGVGVVGGQMIFGSIGRHVPGRIITIGPDGFGWPGVGVTHRNPGPQTGPLIPPHRWPHPGGRVGTGVRLITRTLGPGGVILIVGIVVGCGVGLSNGPQSIPCSFKSAPHDFPPVSISSRNTKLEEDVTKRPLHAS